MNAAPMSDVVFMRRRARLVSLLEQAAELEHGVMCQYIFAAVTMKKTHEEGGVSWAQLEAMRPWRGHIMLVAREEMEHLGLVLNLLTAIGEAPTLNRRDFPFSVSYGGLSQELTLEPFSLQTMVRFALIEMPEKLLPDSAAWKTLAAHTDGGFDPARFDLIAQLYDEVAELIQELPEDRLFIGPPEAQFTTPDIFPGAIRGIDPKAMAKKPAYNVAMRAVIDRASALAVVDQIREEGEGAKEHGGPTEGPDAQPSHFQLFMDILEDMGPAGVGAEQARPVLANPTLAGPVEGRVTHPVTRKVMALFDACYETLLLSLMRYFAHTDESERDLDALQQASFFPMMTTVIRPLAECLTLLPAREGGHETAGPSFVLPPGLRFLPHRDAAFQLLSMRYDAMVEMAEELSQLSRLGVEVLAPVGDRITQVYETLWRSRLNLQRAAGLATSDE